MTDTPADLGATAAPQLNFSLDNPGAPGTIYVSSNPADNTLTLVMSSTVTAGFTAGTLVPPENAMSGTGSLLYLDLTPLAMTAAEFDALTLTADGWTSALYSGASGQYVGFTPTAAVTLQPSPANITLSLGDFTLATAPGSSASLSVLAYRVSGVTSGSFPISSNITVVFATPSDNKGDLTAAMEVSLTPGQVVNSIDGYPQIANALTLTFTQVPNQPTVNSGADTVFTLNFVYATDVNGYGALLTTDEGKEVTVTAAQGTTGWTITPHLDANPPNWTLSPPANSPIFGSGAASTIAFDIGQLVTTFQPGPTVVLIGYSNVPGYKNGSFAITLLKEPHVRISSLTVSPTESVLQNGSADVTLSWQTTYATRLTLQPLGADVTGKTSAPATIQETTEFTLIAEGRRPGNVDNVASLPVLARVLPVINGFTATPAAIYVGDFNGSTGYPTTLAWNVNTNENVTLASSTTGPIGPSYQPSGSVQQPLQTPQMLTLTPQGGSHDPTVSRSLVVSGFDLAAQQVNTGQDSGYVAAPSNAAFVAVTAPSGDVVSILSTANYQPITTVPTGSKPLGVAFSPDGGTMYVANSGDGTVSVFTVAAVESTPPFTFTPAGTVHVGGAPQQVAAGADGAYVSVDLGSSTAGQVAIITGSGGTYSAGTPVTVGQAPRGVALSPGGASLYVANSGSGTISLVTLGGSTPAVGTLLSGIGRPTGVAVTPDGVKLLVAAAGDGAVYGYRASSASTSPRQTYTLAGATSVAALPTGDYAVATGTGPNTLALLNYAHGSVSATRTLPATPAGVGVTTEGGMAIVALPGSSTVEVVTFARYAQVAATTAAGGQITNVAVSPDNRTVVGWSNAMIGTQNGAKSALTGVVKGPASGAGLTPYLAGTKVNWAAVSPAAADDALYVALNGSPQISVYTLSSMTSLATIPIQGQGPAGRQAVALGLSGDGSTLFALVADGSNRYSMLVISADVGRKSFSVVADLSVYTATELQLATPLAVVPTTSGGWAAYALDTTTSSLWAVTGSGSSWSVASSAIQVAPGNASATASAMACSPDGTMAYTALQQMLTNYVSVTTLPAGKATLLQLPDPVMVMNITSLAVSPDGAWLYASDVAAAGIRIFDAQSLRIDQTMTWQQGVQGPWGIAVASDGSSLFSANTNSQNIAIAQQVSPA